MRTRNLSENRQDGPTDFEPSKYAPKWIRESRDRYDGASRLPTAPRLSPAVEEDDAARLPDTYDDRSYDEPSFDDRLTYDNDHDAPLRVRSLEPEFVAEPQWKQPRGFPFGMLMRTGAALVLATGAALIYVGAVPAPVSRVVNNAVAVLNETTGAAARTTPAREPPRPNKVDARVEDDRVAAPQPTAPVSGFPDRPYAVASVAPSAPAAVLTAPAAPAAPPLLRRLEAEEIDTLIRKSESYIVQGDVAPARPMLKRAAEAGSARAALMLAATFDPNMLKRVGVVGFKPDPAQAREWYERAAALGAPEASERLNELGR